MPFLESMTMQMRKPTITEDVGKSIRFPDYTSAYFSGACPNRFFQGTGNGRSVARMEGCGRVPNRSWSSWRYIARL